MNNESITVHTPASFDKETCLQLQDRAEKIYRLHGSKTQIINNASVIFLEFQEKLKEGYSYELTPYSSHLNGNGIITLTLVKPEALQAEEIIQVREKAKADYESQLEQEKEKQIQLLVQQQLQTHLRKEEEKRAKELQKLKLSFEADAIKCFESIKTSEDEAE